MIYTPAAIIVLQTHRMDFKKKLLSVIFWDHVWAADFVLLGRHLGTSALTEEINYYILVLWKRYKCKIVIFFCFLLLFETDFFGVGYRSSDLSARKGKCIRLLCHEK